MREVLRFCDAQECKCNVNVNVNVANVVNLQFVAKVRAEVV